MNTRREISISNIVYTIILPDQSNGTHRLYNIVKMMYYPNDITETGVKTTYKNASYNMQMLCNRCVTKHSKNNGSVLIID